VLRIFELLANLKILTDRNTSHPFVDFFSNKNNNNNNNYNYPLDLTKEIASHLADIFLIGVCLANQYVCNLSSIYHQFASTLDDSEETERYSSNKKDITLLFMIASDIAKIINIYDGERLFTKRVPHLQPFHTLVSTIGYFHREILMFGANCGINVWQAIAEKLKYWETADVFARCALQYDPTTASSLKNFKNIMNQTQCLFAQTSRIWGNIEWNHQLSIEENVKASIESFRKFLKASKYEHLDGYVFELTPGKFYGSTVEKLGESLRLLLTALAKHDSTSNSFIRSENLEKLSWQFSFDQTPTFITTFGPCYPKTHSRYGFGTESVFILFQPEISFGHHNIPSPLDDNPNNIRQKIRANFQRNNRPYHRPRNVVLPVVHLYCKPLDYTDKPLKWWLKDGL